MNKLIITIILGTILCGCSTDGVKPYVIDQIHNQEGNQVLYELTSTDRIFGRYERIWDTVGKYQMGDTVYIILKGK